MTKLNFQHHYSSLQCHMILQLSYLMFLFLILWFFFLDFVMDRFFAVTQ